MWFQVFLSLWSVTSCLWIDKIPEVTKTKVSNTKRYSLSKLRLDHAPLKQLIQTPPHMSTSQCAEICITPPKYIHNERRRSYYSGCSIVAVVSWRRCVSLWKRNYFVWDPKEDTTRNQWLSYIHNTVPEQFNPNIRECAAHLTEDCVLKLEE